MNATDLPTFDQARHALERHWQHADLPHEKRETPNGSVVLLGRCPACRAGLTCTEDDQGDPVLMCAASCPPAGILAALESELGRPGESDDDAVYVDDGPEPPGSPIDFDVLGEARDWLARFLATVTPDDLDLLALWIVHTHLVRETYTTPRLLLDSPVPGSGKTTCLEHMQRLASAPVLMSTVSSPALLVRMLDPDPRTLLIDEADRSLRPDREGTPDVLAVLNSGYKRGATRPVLVPVKGGGWEAKEMPTFAPVAMAGNDPQLPDDTRSRTIRVLLMPDVDGTVEESDWETIEPDAAELADRIRGWADAHRSEVQTLRPPLPAEVKGRFREKWQPLARIAGVVGGRWPDQVTRLAAADVVQAQLDRDDGLTVDRPHVVLLQHLAQVWPEREEFVPTGHLIDDLVAGWPRVWSQRSPYGKDLTAQRLGRMLAGHYRVHSAHSRDKHVRGYWYQALIGAWRRMGVKLPPPPPLKPSGASEPSEPSALFDPTRDGSDASDTRDGSPETPSAGRWDGSDAPDGSTPRAPWEVDR